MKFKTRDIILVALFAALTAVMSQISIPLPFTPIPITMQLVAVCLSGVILGSRLGAVSQLVFLLIGAVGAPVFANFSGGISKILGPSGGYLISFPIVALIIGLCTEKIFNENYVKDKELSCKIKKQAILITASLLGLFVCYTLGVIQLSVVLKWSITKSINLGVLPYVILDLVKVIFVAIVGTEIRSRLINAKLII